MAVLDKLTTTVSTKGQITLPKAIRQALRWHAGTRLTVYCSGPSPRSLQPDLRMSSAVWPTMVPPDPSPTWRQVFWKRHGVALRAIEPNIVVQHLTGDDPDQAARARAAIGVGDVCR